MRMRSVCAATAASTTSGAEQCEYSSRKWCSTAHTKSNPSSSARRACSSALWKTAASTPAVNGRGVDISKKIPNFMPLLEPSRSCAAVQRRVGSLRDDRDPAAHLEDRQADVRQIVDTLLTRRLEHLLDRHVLDPQRSIDRLAVGDEHDRHTLEESAGFRGSPADERHEVDPEAERGEREQRPGDGVVLLHHALLDDVAE